MLRALNNLGLVAHAQGDRAEARRYFAESLDLARELGGALGPGNQLNNLARLAQDEGRFEEARALFDAHASEIDMMLLDVTMPHGEGAEQLLPEFVARRPGAIAIVTSGDDLPPGLEAELERVRGVFLRKPFVPNELLRLVEEGKAEDSADPTGASRGLA